MDDPKQFCKAFYAWAEACETPLPTDSESKKAWRKEFAEHWEFINRAIAKSCLLDRLIYGGETIRKELCPVHKGRWGGCVPKAPECGCSHGSCITAWLPNKDDMPTGESKGVMIIKLPNLDDLRSQGITIQD